MRKYQRHLYLTDRLKLDNYWKGFIENQLIYLADIFADNYNIVRDRFKTKSENKMKYMSFVAKKQKNFKCISLAQSIRQP